MQPLVHRHGCFGRTVSFHRHYTERAKKVACTPSRPDYRAGGQNTRTLHREIRRPAYACREFVEGDGCCSVDFVIVHVLTSRIIWIAHTPVLEKQKVLQGPLSDVEVDITAIQRAATCIHRTCQSYVLCACDFLHTLSPRDSRARYRMNPYSPILLFVPT